MNILESAILGLIQGLTEFLPISSSGHLILARAFLKMPLKGSLAFDVFLNTATLFAVIFCFWGDLKALIKDFRTEGLSARSKTLVYALILGSIPAGIVGFLYGDFIENNFREAYIVVLALVAGSLIMFFADKVSRKGGLSPIKGLVVGFFQALALIPGISRSGSSISGGLFVGLSREESIRFSFLLLIPVSCGALLKVFWDMRQYNLAGFFDLSHVVAFIFAFGSGVWAVKFLVKYLSNHSFAPFVLYRLILATVIAFLLYIN